jgi:hypothetical protein
MTDQIKKLFTEPSTNVIFGTHIGCIYNTTTCRYIIGAVGKTGCQGYTGDPEVDNRSQKPQVNNDPKYIGGVILTIRFVGDVEDLYKQYQTLLKNYVDKAVEIKFNYDVRTLPGAFKMEFSEVYQNTLIKRKKYDDLYLYYVDQMFKFEEKMLSDLNIIRNEYEQCFSQRYPKNYPSDCNINSDWFENTKDYSRVSIEITCHKNTDMYKMIKESAIINKVHVDKWKEYNSTL